MCPNGLEKESVVVETPISFPTHKLCQSTDKTLLKLTKDISQFSPKRQNKAIDINFLVHPTTDANSRELINACRRELILPAI